jgi:hypothetical protein
MRNKIMAVLASSLLSIGLFGQSPKQVPLVLTVGKPTTVKNSITGNESYEYQTKLNRGQLFTVKMTPSSSSCYFNILSGDVTIYNGENNGNQYTGTALQSGPYTIQVYINRAAARKNVKSSFTLQATAKNQDHAVGASSDAQVGQTGYHATGSIPSSFGNDASLSSQSEAGILRGKNGWSEIHLLNGTMQTRVIQFDGKKFSCPGQSCTITAKKSADNWIVDVNKTEHYKIPEAFITGG